MQNQIPKNWQKVKLGDVIEFVDGDRGVNYPKNDELLRSGYCLFLNTKNVPGTGFNFSSSDNQFIAKEIDERLRKGKLKRGDFILTTRGTVGNFAFYSADIPYGNIRINSGMVILRNKSTDLNTNYFNQFLSSNDFKSQVQSLLSGSAQPQLPIRDLSQLKLTLPPLSNQQKIASILSAFDDKIEVNNKIAKNLEEMAQALFKGWFVHFRFPGYERAQFVDSELGKIPKGWKRKKIKGVAKINKGISYSSAEIKDNSVGLPMINLANFQRGGGFNPDGIKFYTGRYKTTDLVKPGDIVVAMTDLTSNREVIGHPARVPSYIHWDKMLISLDVCAVDTEKLYMEFLYYLMLRKEFSYLMASSAGGTNVAHLSKSVIENYSFVLPERNLIQEFQDFIRPIFSQINKVELENQKLAALRDLLLPKLMKGEIRV